MRHRPLPITLGVLAALCLAGPALAAPPLVGTTYTFVDPVFEGTIICDTLEQITTIAAAPEPEEAYANLMMTSNAVGEPSCLTIAPTALVRAVTPLGPMHKGDLRFHAWAVEADLEGTTIFALYLEQDQSIHV